VKNKYNEMFEIIITIILITLSGIFSGLTLGLMSLSPFTLQRKAKIGSKSAQKILPLRKKGNLLLTTLLLGNVAVNAALSIFLGSITAGIIAGIIATSLIVVFGEIIPQAIFARHGLRYGSKFTWIVWFFLIVLYPVTKPAAMLLDYFLGGETPSKVSKRELALMIREQQQIKGSEIEFEDYKLVKKSLDYANKTVRAVMTPIENVFLLQKDTVLNKRTSQKIHNSGHSRIPVLDHEKVIGILFTKDIVLIDYKKKGLAHEVMRPFVKEVRSSEKLDAVLALFKEKRTHMFVVKDSNDDLVGIVTLEDVLEEIIGEIVDEHDMFIDMRSISHEL